MLYCSYNKLRFRVDSKDEFSLNQHQKHSGTKNEESKVWSHIMPNGGVDNCATCYFNKAAKELGNQFIDQPAERDKLFYLLCHCTLRDVKITDPYWTYCRNYFYFMDRSSPPEDMQTKGWILASGLDEGYSRIPWDDKN